MDRKKIFSGLAAFLSGAVLLASSAQAQINGFLAGDPAPGKLVPYYTVGDNLATLIGIENTQGLLGPNSGEGFDITVHVRVYTVKSLEVTNFNLCLSPFAFGFVVLQKKTLNATQLNELFGTGLGEFGTGRFSKARVVTVVDDLIPSEGYVSLVHTRTWDSDNGSCTGSFTSIDASPSGSEAGIGEPLAAWAILQDVGSGFFATEIPVVTANIDDSTGAVLGGFGAFGLIPQGNWVIARYDVNPDVDAQTSVYVWLAGNAGKAAWPAWLDGEDEFEVSTTIPLVNEVNVINPDVLSGMGQLRLLKQYRGVLRFQLPDTGFLWSQITQAGQHYRENFLGYNLENNDFITD
jgi:hypothetical protein